MTNILPKLIVLFLFCLTGTAHTAFAIQADAGEGVVRTGIFASDVQLAPQATSPVMLSVNQAKDGNYYYYSKERNAKESLLVVNRPTNISGLTGLILTTSAFTQAARDFSTSVSILSEKSTKPGYKVTQVPVTITYGITDFVEVGLKAKYINVDSTVPPATRSGAGSSEIALKWRWDTHGDTSPEIAVGLVGVLPTGDDSKGLKDVKNWGTKVIALATSETKIGSSSFLGIYLEAQAVFLDMGTNTQDRHGIINAGLLLPISSGNRLQGMVEYNTIVYPYGRKNADPLTVDESGITPALRYVTEKLNITAGAQFLSKEVEGYKDTIRWIGTVGYKF